jgi:hypothetical protein
VKQARGGGSKIDDPKRCINFVQLRRLMGSNALLAGKTEAL